MVGTARVFRLHYYPECVICNGDVKAACETADVKGLRFAAQGRPPKKPTAFTRYLQANSLRNRGEMAAAIASYGEAIRLGCRDIFYPQYFRSRAEAYFAIKDIDRAITDYDEAIRVNPPNGGSRWLTEPKRAMRLSWLAEAYRGRGEALLEKGDRARGTRFRDRKETRIRSRLIT